MARLGYAFDRFLIYGTGGFAYGGGDRNNGCPTFVNGNNVSRFCDNGGDDTRWGYTFGGGFEWALPVSTVSFFGSTAVTFGVEGLYVNLDDDKGNDRLAGFNAATAIRSSCRAAAATTRPSSASFARSSTSSSSLSPEIGPEGPGGDAGPFLCAEITMVGAH